MSSRTKKMLEMATSQDKYLLDLPKYDTTKGTTKEEQLKALKNIEQLFPELDQSTQIQKNIIKGNPEIEQVPQKMEISIQTKPNNRDTFVELESSKKKSEENYSDEEIYESSGSEYVPENESESDDDDADLNVTRTVENGSNELTSINKQNNETNESEDNTDFNLRTIEINSLNELTSGNKQNTESTNKTESSADRVILSYEKILQSTSTNIEQFANVRPWTKKNSCPYCFQDVTHFPRHLQRNHQKEGAVQKFLAMSIKDPKRKQLLNAIRRQGNYISTSQTNVIHPIRRPKALQSHGSNEENLKDKYVVCSDCLGYFKRNYLRRHRKQCALRSKSHEIGNREQHLSTAQLFSVCSGAHNDFYLTLRLKSEVFPIMRNDEISKIAMSDILICCYADSQLRKHKRKQIRNVISNKMRELGRLLLNLKQITGVHRLFDIMKPQFFDNFVSATKIISGYDEETHTFKASSLALHMGTTLKQVCDIATKMVIKKSPFFPCLQPEESLKDIKRLKNLIENHWNAELSSLALKDLNEKRYENPKLLPLTQDVMKFQEFVLKEANIACIALRDKREINKFYRRLSECVLALTLLLNRKRIGEIQFLKSETYSRTIPQNQQEEFLQALTEAERTLTKKFKRVVTEGKGSRPVAILFPKDIQEFIEALFSVRDLCVPSTNEYLFANPNTKNGWLSGYHTLKKLAEESGVSDKSLFTSTRLRKQIATVLQVMNITDEEMEQFARFMGHTRKTHESYYRLPQDVYQTAKVSKLLIAINKGKGSLYKGKSLDEIEISDKELSDSDTENIGTNVLLDKNKIAGVTQANPIADENDSSHLEVQTLHNNKDTATSAK